jgi:DNA modification methylase
MRGLSILTGDCREILPALEAQSVQCCVSSPPYWGLRDYGTAQWEGGSVWCEHLERLGDGSQHRADGFDTPFRTGANYVHQRTPDRVCRCGARRIDSQLGLEATPEEYIAKMAAVFMEVWRVLRDDGTLWVNMGDSYAHGIPGGDCVFANGRTDGREFYDSDKARGREKRSTLAPGLKPKDLCMMPARLAIALQASGWYLRSEIVWHKPNPMPESVTDRPTKAHEMIYLLAKQERYFYDAEAIREPNSENSHFGRKDGANVPVRLEYLKQPKNGGQTGLGACNDPVNGRNKRTVWTVATQPYAEAHFATFPEEIPKLCILAGSKLGDTILDPFAGSGTVGRVALELGRRAVLIELNPAYIELAEERTFVTPGFL